MAELRRGAQTRSETREEAICRYFITTTFAVSVPTNALNYLLPTITMASGYGNNGGMCIFSLLPGALLQLATPITACASSSLPG